jgi:hypothetical protein
MTTQSPKPLFLFVFRNQLQSQPGPSPEEMQQMFGRWMKWVDTLKAKGIYHGGNPLEDGGKMLRGPNGRNLTDGPFAETKEIVGGYMVVSADSLDQAALIAQDCPGFAYGGCVEVRPIDVIPGM